MDLVEKGSQTAKNGFKNEDDIINKFNNWKNDNEAQEWLTIMNFNLADIEYVTAIKIGKKFKADVQVQVTIKLKSLIDLQNIQVKLVSNKSGFNQIDKRKLDMYHSLWNIPENVLSVLKRYSGEISPSIENPKNKRRMYANEFSEQEQMQVLDWLSENKMMIVADILKGRGQFAAEWMLVAQKINNNARWILKPINFCMNFYANGEVRITKKGNFRIGNIGMQRKGGDGGRDSAKLLQFKINPATLFEH